MMTRVVSLVNLLDRRAASLGLLTWLFSFGYQILFYSIYKAYKSSLIVSNPTVFSYYSGVFGDGVLVPTLNVLVFMLLRELGGKLVSRRLTLALFLGLGLTLGAHYVQASWALTNWSMPTAYNWSGVGRFHFFFMWAESSYLFYALMEIIRCRRIMKTDFWAASLLGLSLLVLGAFGATFLADYLKVLGV